jgi:hypothetical protein
MNLGFRNIKIGAMKELTICTRRRRELLQINLGFRNIEIGAMKELTICTRRRKELLLIKCWGGEL